MGDVRYRGWEDKKKVKHPGVNRGVGRGKEKVSVSVSNVSGVFSLNLNIGYNSLK